ncbi:MAG: hypothetical protein AMS22_00020 [Thiotrichales bacterium SG8_50]|nr:MAG: hypothetical protein AMS22_00020 [Thiotrichales bacterium SG8_50]
MLRDADLGFDRNDAVYVREFVNDVDGAEEQRLIQARRKLDAFFRDIVFCSLQLVAIAEAHDNEADRVAAYVELLKPSGDDDRVLEAPGVDQAEYLAILDKVAAQETFLDALKAASPIFTGVARYMDKIVTELADATNALAGVLDARIDAEFADVIRFQEALEREKYTILLAMEALYDTNNGDAKAFERNRTTNAVQRRKLIPRGEPTEDRLYVLGEHLMERLDTLHRIEQEIEPDWKRYRATHAELQKLANDAQERRTRARFVVITWLRAHQKMAAAIENPAEWFDYKDAPSALFKLLL